MYYDGIQNKKNKLKTAGMSLQTNVFTISDRQEFESCLESIIHLVDSNLSTIHFF